MMHHLEMPDKPSRPAVDGKQAIAKQIGTRSIRAIEVIFRAGCRNVDYAALFIQRHPAPGVGAPNRLPCILGPRIISKRARMWDGMECPDQPPGKNIVGPN